MPEKTKRKQEIELSDEKEPRNDKQGNWSEDQKNKSYYYDDSYGYEVYNPDEDDDETELNIPEIDK